MAPMEEMLPTEMLATRHLILAEGVAVAEVHGAVGLLYQPLVIPYLAEGVTYAVIDLTLQMPVQSKNMLL